MSKCYLSAPLPFQGQKRMFAREFKNVLKQFPDTATFVDLFGGSGLLSHVAKREKPNATVVYNDFDGYRKRLKYIPQTNELLEQLRLILNDYPRKVTITGTMRERILSCIREHEHTYGYVDYITLSGSLLFSMKYATCYEDLQRETLYNRVKAAGYPPADDYLDGLVVTSCDYDSSSSSIKIYPAWCSSSTRPISPPTLLLIKCIGNSPTTLMCCTSSTATASSISPPISHPSSSYVTGWARTATSAIRSKAAPKPHSMPTPTSTPPTPI